MNDKNITKLDITNDFGFSFEYETDPEVIKETITTDYVSKISDKDDIIKNYKERIQSLGKVILPLLQQLSKEPDKPMIKWENRKEILDKQIKLIKDLTNI